MTAIKKISVIGAGAIGSMFGGLIKRHDPTLDVVLITRGDHCKVIQERGYIALQGKWGQWDVPVKASSDPADIAASDLVLFTVKTQDTAETAKQFADAIGDAIVVSIQNGINQHILSNILQTDRLLVGMTATNMAITEPGVVVCQRRGVSVIGAASDEVAPAVVQQARETLAKSGLQFETSDTILGAQYNKLLFNTMGYASVISATDFLGVGILDRDWRNSVAMPILAEGLRVLEAANVPLQRVSGMSDIVRFGRLLRALDKPGLGLVGRMLMQGPLKPPHLVFSVYLDLMRNRPTEIDYVNGEIVRLAESCSVDAPYNAEVVRLIHEMENATEQQFLTQQEVASRFRLLGR